MKWEKPICNLCESKKNRVFLKDIGTWEYPEKFNILECKNCNLKFLSPRPTSKNIGKYYDEKSYWGNDLTRDGGVKKVVDKEKSSYSKIYRLILNKYGSTGSVFDAGAGTGIFLNFLKKKGWKVGGNELSQDAVRFAKKVHGIDLIAGDFNNIQLEDNKYEVITFNSSLEHMYDPNSAIVKAKRSLKNGGVVIITVPNIDSLGFKFLKRNWLPLHPPKHLYHFSEKTLKDLVENAGLEVIKEDRFIFDHAYYGIYNSFRYKYSPKFQQLQLSGKDNELDKTANKNKNLFLKKEFGKIFFSLVSLIVVLLGIILGKGETITIYAKKT